MLSYLFSNPLVFFIYLIALMVAITIHEFSHALAADYLGDPTPRLAGRLSFNPLVHIDPLGLVFLLFIGFGWGKPVQFDPYNLRSPRRDAAIISLAGPVSNFLLATILSFLLRLTFLFGRQGTVNSLLLVILPPIIVLNVVLGVFNLLPFHPLDGFKVVGGLLSEKRAHEWYGLQRYGFIFLLLIIIPLGSSSILDSFIRPLVNFIVNVLLPGSSSTGGIV